MYIRPATRFPVARRKSVAILTITVTEVGVDVALRVHSLHSIAARHRTEKAALYVAAVDCDFAMYQKRDSLLYRRGDPREISRRRGREKPRGR